jgi:hypothetical protein
MSRRSPLSRKRCFARKRLTPRSYRVVFGGSIAPKLAGIDERRSELWHLPPLGPWGVCGGETFRYNKGG